MLEEEYSNNVIYAKKYLQKYYPFVFNSGVDVEGCIDEALAKAHLTFNNSYSFRTYFTRILKNQVLNEFRWLCNRNDILNCLSIDHPYSFTKTPSNRKVQDYLPYFDSFFLFEVKSILTESEYEFFKVYFFSGYRQRELTKIYKVSRQTINNRLKNIKSKLSKFY